MARTKKIIPISVQYKNYILASVHLYGTIYVEELIKLIEKYEGKEVDRNLLVQIIQVLGSIPYVGLSNYQDQIIGNRFFSFSDKNSLKDAKQILETKLDFQRYIPTKNEFLKYADEEYFEPILQTLRLQTFILKNRLCEFESIEDLDFDMFDLRNKILANFPLEDIIHDFFDKDYEFKRESDLHMFMDLVIDIINHTRRYDLLGNTSYELMQDKSSSQLN